MSVLLSGNNVKTWSRTDRGLVKAVDRVSYHVSECEIISLVGESGCGKTTTDSYILRLYHPTKAVSIVGEPLKVHHLVNNGHEYTERIEELSARLD